MEGATMKALQNNSEAACRFWGIDRSAMRILLAFVIFIVVCLNDFLTVSVVANGFPLSIQIQPSDHIYNDNTFYGNGDDGIDEERGEGGGDVSCENLDGIEDGSCFWKDPDTTATDQYCTLVVAPSTIPNAGLGVFTLVDMKPDQTVGETDLVIPIEEVLTFAQSDDRSSASIFQDYLWNGRIYQGSQNAFTPGLQCLANSHLGLFSVFPVPAKKVYSNTDNNDDDSTMYHHMESVMGEEFSVPAGGELFAMYGDHWFQGRSEKFSDSSTYVGTTMAMSDDYETAEDLANQFQSSFGDYDTLENWYFDLWELVREFVYTWNGHSSAQVLPAFHDLRQTQQLGIRSLYQSQASRPVDELLESINVTARCIDGIRPGPSSIHRMGAFAKRLYPKGSIITGSPLLQSQLSAWNTKAKAWDAESKSYKIVEISGDDQYEGAIFENYALLINYCWSHRSSSILLCPYAPGVSYINHASSTIKNQRKPPNVRIQWAPDGQISHSDKSFQLTPDDLALQNGKVMLALDYIALRDIAPGEELLIDYGTAWEEAHDAFLRQKKSKSGTTVEVIHRYNEQALLKTEMEQLTDPYPNDIELKCHPSIMTDVLELEGDDVALWSLTSHASHLDCSVLERQTMPVSDGSIRIVYAVRVFFEGTWRGRGGIPRRYIRFFASENQPSNVFRFPMQLPDEMLPDAWKDL